MFYDINLIGIHFTENYKNIEGADLVNQFTRSKFLRFLKSEEIL